MIRVSYTPLETGESIIVPIETAAQWLAVVEDFPSTDEAHDYLLLEGRVLTEHAIYLVIQ